jgi:hypothetical protein
MFCPKLDGYNGPITLLLALKAKNTNARHPHEIAGPFARRNRSRSAGDSSSRLAGMANLGFQAVEG